MPGEFQTKGVVYKATITKVDEANGNTTETYTVMTGGAFRKRHYGHVSDMKEEKERRRGPP